MERKRSCPHWNHCKSFKPSTARPMLDSSTAPSSVTAWLQPCGATITTPRTTKRRLTTPSPATSPAAPGPFAVTSPAPRAARTNCASWPAGHQSGWVINGDIRLAHLYFSPEQFALGCVTLLDREPRELQLREGTFLDDPQQARRFRQMLTLNWDEPANACSPAAWPMKCSAMRCSARSECAKACDSRGAWPRISGGNWWSSSTVSWLKPSVWGSWRVMCAVGVSLCADVSR